MTPSILLVDDDPLILRAFGGTFEWAGLSVTTAKGGMEALKLLGDGSFDVVATELNMPSMDGISLCERVRAGYPEMAVVIFTGQALRAENVVRALRAGAVDFLEKPLEPSTILSIVQKAKDRHRDRGQGRADARESDGVGARERFGGLIGGSKPMRAVYDDILRAAAAQLPVLIHGETGVGKELVAREIHARSARAAEPFVAVNCAAIPPSLLAAELFGHVAGAYTDAKQARQGVLRKANRGTLLLDEIGELAVQLQASLLRVLEDRVFCPVGSDQEVPLKARILATTNVDLEQALEEGAFRRDLYHRLCVLEIRIPAVRDRREDLPLLVEHALDLAAAELGVACAGFDSAARSALYDYSWPGNVRELRAAVVQSAHRAAGRSITLEDLPQHVRAGGPRDTPSAGEELGTLDETRVGSLFRVEKPLTLAELDRQYISAMIEHFGGNRAAAARALGISRSWLYQICPRPSRPR